MRLRVGVSACLLGETVRWDGGHKRDAFVAGTLGRWVEWVPVCPEVELGLGVPREPIRLEGDPRSPRLVAIRTRTDHSAAMARLVAARADALARRGLAGYVLKAGSPSCGFRDVPVFGTRGRRPRPGVGLFARALGKRLPFLPLEDEVGLGDPARREHFVERLFAHARWTRFLAGRPGGSALARFHARHELQLRAHDPAAARRLGRLAGRAPSAATLAAYGQVFMRTLAVGPSRADHARVLGYALARLAAPLEPAARADVVRAIAAYRRGRTARAVPLALLRRHARRLAIPALAQQTYLELHRAEVALRGPAG